MLAQDEDFPKYVEDTLPDHIPEEQTKKFNKRYKAVREEYYSRTGHRPVTPKNFDKWFAKAKGKNLRWHFWELCSGSGRLTLVMVMAGLLCGFPVDIRYGWDINDYSHQTMLKKAYNEFAPILVHASPDCAHGQCRRTRSLRR